MDIYKEYLQGKVETRQLLQKQALEVLTPAGVKPAWITPDGELYTNKELDVVSHIDAVDQHPELFDLPEGEIITVKDGAMENGAIRLAMEGVAYINPSEEAFQKLREVVRHNSNRTSILIDDQNQGESFTVPKKLITRSRSLDKFMERLKERALIESFQQNNITFSRNQNEGDPEPAGFVPLSAQDRKFFTIDMSCFDFESITPDRGSDRNVEFLKELIKEGKPIAPPFLSLYWRTDGGFWEVRSHEGRGRCLAIKEVFGGSNVIPVDIFFKKREDGETVGMRSPTEEMIESLKTDGIIPQQRAPLSDGLVDDKELFLQHIDIKAVKNLP